MKKTLFFLSIGIFFCLISCTQEDQTLTIATYNVRLYNTGDSLKGNGWEQRVPIINDLILFHDFDIFGTQEGKINQLKDMKNGLPGYDYIGVGREDGKDGGEFSAIFYKTRKFELLNSGNFWLSEDTQQPNKGWDAECIRICTWGEWKELQSGFRFYFFNLHMDHIGVNARKNSAQLILDTIKAMTGNQPVILTGDFNIDQNNESYLLINQSKKLRDAYDLAKIRYATNGTFNGFNPHLKTESRIDHIFLTKEFKVERYGILTDSYRRPKHASSNDLKMATAPQEISFGEYEARMPSDHFPVVIKVRY
ncbi:MAG: endonuclease/exonuclease/phosphatase family protein [Dysgonamonadaceae bacterium]|jgi:endonuclease/exonuclease/phosphatase family metal-dependent hydrolase|nr:endonuclease/exonuclease/phosphatase family protein [Dysgonamonadaceae bacterium]